MGHKLRTPFFWLVIMLHWGAIYTYVPLLTPHAQDLRASLQMVGLITGSYGLVQLLLRVPLGILSDRIGRRRIFVTLGIVCGTAGAVLLLVGKTPGWVLAARCLAGAAASAYVAIAVLYTSTLPADRVAKSTTVISAVSACGQLIAMTVGGWLAGYGGIRWAFMLAIAMGTAGIGLSCLLPDPPVKTAPMEIKGFGKVLRSPGLIAASLIAALAQSLYFGKALGFAPAAARALDVGAAHLSFVTTLVSLCTFAASMLAAWRLLAWWGEKKLILFGFMIYIVSCAMMPFAGNLGLILISQALTGLAQGLIFPLLMGLSIQNVPADRKATAMGFYQATYGLGMFLGPWLFGILGDSYSLNVGFWFSTAVAAIGLTWTWLWLRRKAVITA